MRKTGRGQVKDVHLHILGQRRLRAKPKCGYPHTDTQREKQFRMTYISGAQSIAKMYPTVLGSWLQQTWTRGGGGVEQRERPVGARERAWL